MLEFADVVRLFIWNDSELKKIFNITDLIKYGIYDARHLYVFSYQLDITQQLFEKGLCANG